ncbi:MAG: YggS family pyridoxal phosphate-dependent enzyme [Acidobacteriota bacterium]|nr:YggS family pyridoxal phosphate-dependent enzyme [Acidobacteriota bacterium]
MTGMFGRLRVLRDRIAQACGRCGRDPADIELLPVSKRQSMDAVREAVAHGFYSFGENYVQEGVAKHLEMPELKFNLIGPLQRNKAKVALLHFAEIQTLDRVDLAARLVRLAEELRTERGVWIQMDLWDEPTKAGGCPEAELPAILSELGQSGLLKLRGFMAIPPPGLDAAFAEMAKLRERWRQKTGLPLLLSMGMSSDLEAAIEAGSDQIRIGTALFGERALQP